VHRSDRQAKVSRAAAGAHRRSRGSRILGRLGLGAAALAATAVLMLAVAVVAGGTSLSGLRQVLGGSGGPTISLQPPLTGDTTGASGTAGTTTSRQGIGPSGPAPVTPPTTATTAQSARATTSSAVTSTTPGRSTPVSRSSTSRSSLPSSSTAVPPGTTAPAALADQVLAQLNQARAAAGVPALTMSTGLVASAAAHNQVMAGGCGLSHQCPAEPALGDRISAHGVSWHAAGENIGEGGPVQSTDAAVLAMAQQLTGSMLAETPPNDGHRRNILSASFTHVGISLYRDSAGTVWLTQDFSG
jgi:uncharacterized protein YkwD